MCLVQDLRPTCDFGLIGKKDDSMTAFLDCTKVVSFMERCLGGNDILCRLTFSVDSLCLFHQLPMRFNLSSQVELGTQCHPRFSGGKERWLERPMVEQLQRSALQLALAWQG